VHKALQQSSHACTIKGVGDTLYAIIQPRNWMAIFAVILIFASVTYAYRKISSKYAFIVDYRGLAIAAVLFIIVAAFSYGCS